MVWPSWQAPRPAGRPPALPWSGTRPPRPAPPTGGRYPGSAPRCRHPEETVEHQLWYCPQWDAVRQAEASKWGLDAVTLGRGVGPLTRHALLRPPCPLRAVAAAQVSHAPLPVVRGLLALAGPRAEAAWTDGAACDAGSCGLGRAAWAVHFGAGGRALAGPVPGSQTAQRAELFAAAVAASLARGPLLIVTDSQYVAAGTGQLSFRLRLLDRRHADLWQVLWRAARGGGLSTRWVPSHRDRPDPPLLSEADWVGNAEAGRLAGAVLSGLRPEPALRAAVQSAAAALESQLAWAHQGIADGPTRFPRRRARFMARPSPRGRPPRWRGACGLSWCPKGCAPPWGTRA